MTDDITYDGDLPHYVLEHLFDNLSVESKKNRQTHILRKNCDFPSFSDDFSEISIRSKGFPCK